MASDFTNGAPVSNSASQSTTNVSASASVDQQQIAQLQARINEYQQREQQYQQLLQQDQQQLQQTQQQLDLASQQIQQFQQFLMALQQRGLIQIQRDGSVVIPSH